MARRALLGLAALWLGLVALPIPPVAAAPPSAAGQPAYVPPVDAAVVDPFRAPTSPYGPGNRGLEYGTAPDTPVAAAAAGTVTFAGLVAGSRHVTVLHPDGIRTTYSFLARIDVVVGQRIAQGDMVGTTVGHLHLGARVGDAYIDPAVLFEGGPARVRLVPFDEPPGSGPRGERSAVAQLIGGVGRAVSHAAGQTLDAAAATADWLRDGGGQTVRTAVHYIERVGPGRSLHLLRTGVHAWVTARAMADRPCTPAEQPVPAPPVARHVAVLVAGLGSSSEQAGIDDVGTAALGYDGADVVRFSYRGGRTPDATDGFQALASTSYGPEDTQADLRSSGTRLADLIETIAESAQGAPVDVYAHSQGGLVTRLALIELERRHGTDWLTRVGLVATLGTPHGGADLATAVFAVGTTPTGSAILDGAGAIVGLDHDSPSVRQLAETSDLIAELRATPPPANVHLISVAARGDPVVPVPRTELPGTTQVVVPLVGVHAHDLLPGSAAAGRELALALGGRSPTCTGFGAALTDELVGEAISFGEDSLGAGAWVASAR